MAIPTWSDGQILTANSLNAISGTLRNDITISPGSTTVWLTNIVLTGSISAAATVCAPSTGSAEIYLIDDFRSGTEFFSAWGNHPFVATNFSGTTIQVATVRTGSFSYAAIKSLNQVNRAFSGLATIQSGLPNGYDVIDGNTDTNYDMTWAGSRYWSVDLNGSYLVKTIGIKADTGDVLTGSLVAQWSLDNTTWATLANVGAGTNIGSNFPIPAGSYVRYIRVMRASDTQNPPAPVYEVTAWV